MFFKRCLVIFRAGFRPFLCTSSSDTCKILKNTLHKTKQEHYTKEKSLVNKNFDNCVSFHIEDGAFMGRLVRLDEVVNTIVGKHCYPKPVSAVVAESAALGALLASALKYDGLFTLQTKSNGPVSMVVVDVSSDGTIRACATFDEKRIQKAQELRKTEGEIEAAPHLMGEGYLAFTVDQGKDTDLYQGVVDLQGKNLTECALRYFKQSEQIETALRLFLKVPNDENDHWKAGGIMLQKLPATGGKVKEGTDLDEAWNEAVTFMQSLKEEEIFDDALSSEEILHRLYHSSKLTIAKNKEYRFGCRCSRDKLLNTLISFGEEEINNLADDHNQISATCNFCSEKYVFDKGELIRH